jgi:hypothetical protein
MLARQGAWTRTCRVLRGQSSRLGQFVRARLGDGFTTSRFNTGARSLTVARCKDRQGACLGALASGFACSC